MPTIYDNIEKHLEAGLTNTLDGAIRADFCIGYFNLRGWRKLYRHAQTLSGGCLPDEFGDDTVYKCRILIGMQMRGKELVRQYFSSENENRLDNAEALKLKKRLASDFKEQLMLGFPSNSDEKALRMLSSQIKAGIVTVRLFLAHPLHAKLYLIFRDDYNSPVIGFLGSSNLTLAGILKQGELNVDVVEQDAANKLVRWFQDRWEDRWCIDISKELCEIIDESWVNKRKPYHIYLKIAYHLSREARAGISEFALPRAFKNSLLEYQANAVKVAARHLYKRGGVMIGDVVGLGKTITAAALAKIFEDDFFLETLIVCPKNLVTMWEDYVHKYQMKAKVLSVTKVRTQLPKERRYRLVIIDESHNLRNREGKRYRSVYEYVRLNDSKVILLTATPYNKSYADLSSQLRLFLDEDQDLGLSPERFIASVGGRVRFLANFQANENSIAAFEKSDFADDWNELMRLFLVRRTRSFIKANYAETDEKTGRKYLLFPDGTKSYFPDRIPKRVAYEFDPDDPHDQYARLYSETVVDIINSLNLPRYGLGQDQYREKTPDAEPTDKEKKIQANLGRAGARLKGFARTNLFKRLESSGYSFLLSVSRHILRNHLFLYALENDRPFPIGRQDAGLVDDFIYTDADAEEDAATGLLFSEQAHMQKAEDLYNTLFDKHFKKYDWIRSGLFSNRLKKHLQHDSGELLRILHLGENWDPGEDRQLNALHALCSQTHKNEKVLIFTQYSDTARYLAGELKKRKLGSVACVTGASENPTEIAHRFSPESNEKQVGASDQIRVLISTDVLSEGQNLQDAHIVLNFDLPWAIIRLIQRAGRIDRIGQKSPKILCYSFLPEDGIENVINLRGRLRRRIRENAETIGSDEVFFDGDPVNIRDLYNEKSGLFDEDEDMEIDLASHAYQIWKNAVDADPELRKIIPGMPDVVYSAKKVEPDFRSGGAIVYTKTANDNDVLAWVDENKNIVTQSQFEILKAAKCDPDEPAMPRPEWHHELVTCGVSHIKNVEAKVGGQLGKKSGPRYRAYTRLSKYAEKYADSLFVTDELKKTIGEIYTYPLREYARDVINSRLKMGINDEELAELAMTLREDGKLCVISNEKSERTDPRIICSLGLVK